MQRFAIVEFEDGLQLVPSAWMLDNEKECFWPPYTNFPKINQAISKCEVVSDNWKTLKIIRVFGTANSYESGIEKVKLAEQFSDIDSTDNEKSKSSRKNHAKKTFDIDETDSNDETLSLPPPPKMPSTLANKYPTKFSKSQSSKVHNYAHASSKILKDSSNSTDTKESSPRIIFTSSKTFKENYNPTDFMKESSPLTNNSELVTKIQLLMSTYAADVELKKELLRRTNQIFVKLESIDDRLCNIEKVNSVSPGVNDNIYDFTEIISLPLQNQDDVKALEHDLKEKDFFSKMVTFMANLSGKDSHDLTVFILKHVCSNSLSTLYTWNGTKVKQSFKDLLLTKCIMKCVRSKFNCTEKEIVDIISKWLIQRKLRKDRDEEKLKRICKENVDPIDMQCDDNASTNSIAE